MSTQTTPDRFLEHDGVRLRWRLEGTGPAIVLLHGWALDLDSWNPVAARLAAHLTVLRFDRRGFGQSGSAPDIRRNAADLHQLLAAAGIDRAVLVGMSQGARLALHFACGFAQRVRALVLDGPPAFDSEPGLPLEHFRHELETRGTNALQSLVLQHPLMQLATGDATAQRLLAEVVARYRGLDLRRPAVHAPPPPISAIGVPVMILNGALDSSERRDAGRRLQAGIPGAERVEMPHAGHLALLDVPEAYARTIHAFCARLPP